MVPTGLRAGRIRGGSLGRYSQKETNIQCSKYEIRVPPAPAQGVRTASQTTAATLATLGLDAMPEVAAWVADY